MNRDANISDEQFKQEMEFLLGKKMRTTIICNSLKELKTVSEFYGIEVKSSEIAVSFPYRFEIEVQETISKPVVEKDYRSGRYIAYHEHDLGIVSQGDTEVEALINLRKEIQIINGYMDFEEFERRYLKNN